MGGVYRHKKTRFGDETHTSYGYDSVDLLEEGLKEFLESGNDARRIVSCLIKTQISIELIFKEYLKGICPALILERIDDEGIQVIKIFSLEGKTTNRTKNNKQELRTANFVIILKRLNQFVDLSAIMDKLLELSKLRNEVVHHEININLDDINLLLAKDIFPFMYSFLEPLAQRPVHIASPKIVSLDVSLWKRLEKVTKSMIDLFEGNLMKKITFFEDKYERLTPGQIKEFSKTNVVLGPDDVDAFIEDCQCPSCKNDTLWLIIGIDYDWNPDGTLQFPYRYMKCPMCGLELQDDEIRYIQENPKSFFKTGKANRWSDIDHIFDQDRE